jgi:hypothetical protein
MEPRNLPVWIIHRWLKNYSDNFLSKRETFGETFIFRFRWNIPPTSIEHSWMEPGWVVYKYKVPTLLFGKKIKNPMSTESNFYYSFFIILIEKNWDLWDPNDFAWDLHMLASFLSTLIVHPIFEAIYESGWHFPFWCTAHETWVCLVTSSVGLYFEC